MAQKMGRAPSSVSREVRRNGGRERYRAAEADAAAIRRRRRPKPTKLALSARLRAEVEARLKLLWSPRQISAWLKREHSDNPQMQVSHETIYISLYVQGRGTLRKELTKHLRSQRTYRRAKNELRPTTPRKIPNPILISARQPRPTTGLCLDIGKVTCCWEPQPLPSALWSSAVPAT
jgi:IS30 family transposase